MIQHKISLPGFDYNTYRAARVRSLFNAESSAFDLTASLPSDETDWRIGVIVGQSGSGKSSLGRGFWSDTAPAELDAGWQADTPIIDEIAPDAGNTDRFDEAASALSSVGLGSVPSWLRPFRVLSCGEQFRAGLARVIAERPARVILDEFTSALDREVAKIAAGAFAKAWRKADCGQCLILTCHADVLDWLGADWEFDTGTGEYRAGRGRRRPKIGLEIYQTGWQYWPLFAPHHYLKLPPMVCAKCYVGFVGGEAVCHLGVTTHIKSRGVLEARMARFVVMPEWQGAGIGTRFLNTVAEFCLQGGDAARLPGRPMTSLINTSHPGLIRALRRDGRWRCVSADGSGLCGIPAGSCASRARVARVCKHNGFAQRGIAGAGRFRTA